MTCVARIAGETQMVIIQLMAVKSEAEFHSGVPSVFRGRRDHRPQVLGFGVAAQSTARTEEIVRIRQWLR